MVDYVHVQYGHEYICVEAQALHVQEWALVGSEYQGNMCLTMTSSFSNVHVYTLYCVVCIPYSAKFLWAFNFTNFMNFPPFVKIFQQKILTHTRHTLFMF